MAKSLLPIWTVKPFNKYSQPIEWLNQGYVLWVNVLRILSFMLQRKQESSLNYLELFLSSVVESLRSVTQYPWLTQLQIVTLLLVCCLLTLTFLKNNDSYLSHPVWLTLQLVRPSVALLITLPNINAAWTRVDTPTGRSDWHPSVDSALLGAEHWPGDWIYLPQSTGSPYVCDFLPSAPSMQHTSVLHLLFQLPDCRVCAGCPVLLLIQFSTVRHPWCWEDLFQDTLSITTYIHQLHFQ